MPEYRPGGTVLAYHGTCIYQAKILEARLTAQGPEYFVHWQGWAKKWDQWVKPGRMMEINAQTKELQSKVNSEANATEAARTAAAMKPKQAKTKATKHKAAVSTSTSSSSSVAKPAAATRDASSEDPASAAVAITIPFALRKVLVDDWEFITGRSCLVRIPKRPLAVPSTTAGTDAGASAKRPRLPETETFTTHDTSSSSSSTSSVAADAASSPPFGPAEPSATVEQILRRYLKDCTDSMDRIKGITQLVEAVILYFDRSLAPFLLYRFERLQLRKYLQERPESDKRSLSQVYGAEHLLRLFIKLPKLLSHARLASKDAAVLAERLNHLVAWLDSNRLRYFTTDYVRASEEYATEVAAMAESMRSPWD